MALIDKFEMFLPIERTSVTVFGVKFETEEEDIFDFLNLYLRRKVPYKWRVKKDR